MRGRGQKEECVREGDTRRSKLKNKESPGQRKEKMTRGINAGIETGERNKERLGIP
jgi:hypothetical protein